MTRPDGYTQEELRKIAAREMGANLPMSATDINARIPYAVAQVSIAQLRGFTKDELKEIAEHKTNAPAPMQAHHINKPMVQRDDFLNHQLEILNNFLGFKLS